MEKALDIIERMLNDIKSEEDANRFLFVARKISHDEYTIRRAVAKASSDRLNEMKHEEMKQS